MAGSTVAQGSVVLSVKFDDITGSITSALQKAMGGATTTAGSGGSSAGSSFSSGFAAKAGGVAGLVSSAVSTATSVVTSSIGDAISRVDTLNNYPKVMQNLGYSADDASASIEKIQKSLKGLPSSTDSVASMVQQLAPMCSSLDEATNLGLAMNDMFLASGASTADVSRAMQQYTQILTKGKPDLQDWKTLQEVMPGQLNQVAQALLGAGASSTDLYNALKDGTLTMDDFNNAVMQLDQTGGDGFASFSQQAKDSTQGIGTAITNVGTAVSRGVGYIIEAIGAENISGAINTFSAAIESGFQAAAGFVSAYLVPAFSTIKDTVSNVFSSVSAFISEHSGAIGTALSAIGGSIAPLVVKFSVLPSLVSKFAAVKTALDPLFSTLSLLGTYLGESVSKLGLLKGAWSFFTTGLNPVTLIVAAVAALAAGLVYFFTQTETGQAALSSILSILSEGFSAAMTTLSPMLQTLGETLSTTLAATLPSIGQTLMEIATVISGVIIAVLPTVISILTQIGSVLLQVAQAILPVVIAAVGAIATFISTNMTTISAVIMGAMNIILTIVNATWPVVQAVIEAALNVIQAVISTVMAAINGDWEGVWNGIQSILSAVWDGMCSIVSSVINAISSIISGILSTIQSIWESAWNACGSLLSSAWDGMSSAVSSGINAVLSFVSSIPSGIMSALGNVGSLLYEAGSSIISGLLNGLTSAISGVYDFVSGIAGTIASLKGPLPYDRKVLIPNGEALMESLGTGLDNGFGDVEDMVSDMAGTISSDMSIAGVADYRATGTYSMSQKTDTALNRVIALLESLDSKNGDIYLDGSRVSTALAASSLRTLAGRGYA